MRSNLIRRTTSEWTLLHSDFLLHKKISHMLRHSSLFAKRHARLNCSLVNAFATFRCRYHLFASMPSAQISLWCGKAKTRHSNTRFLKELIFCEFRHRPVGAPPCGRPSIRANVINLYGYSYISMNILRAATRGRPYKYMFCS